MTTRRRTAIRHWWINANDNNPDASRRWHWRQFFQNPSDPKENFDWGGPDWIKSSKSFQCIEEMLVGDIVVAYQASEGVVGLAYLASDGYEHEGSRNFDSFDLRASPTIYLSHHIPYQIIRDLPGAESNIEFVQARMKQGTVFRITAEGFNGILNAILDYNPDQLTEIATFLPDHKFQSQALPVAADTDGLEQPQIVTSTTQRVVRDSAQARALKRTYQWTCQVCGRTIQLPDGTRYAEVHHLRPLGGAHRGNDGHPNTIVVCPQHHAMFDLGVIAINPSSLKVEHYDSSAEGHGVNLALRHQLDSASLRYHYGLFNKIRKSYSDQ